MNENFHFCALYSLGSTGGETRTPSLWFWRPLLCQLSYTRLCLRWTPGSTSCSEKNAKVLLFYFIINLKGLYFLCIFFVYVPASAEVPR